MSKVVWPEALKNNSACRSLEMAMEQKRLGHALLMVADDVETADTAARALAEGFLEAKLPHADYTSVQPMNKQRQIGVEPMREMREFLQKSSLTGLKVAHISQAERLNISAANLFLKILEEPPAGTLILMTTSEPYAVLPTIVSRAMRFRFGSADTDRAQHAALASWSEKLKAFIKGPQRTSVIARMALMNEALQMMLAYEEERGPTPDRDDETPKEVLEAMEAGRLKAFKKEFFAALENVVLESFKESPSESHRLTAAMKAVEKAYRLTEFNLNTTTALESAVGGVIEALAS